MRGYHMRKTLFTGLSAVALTTVFTAPAAAAELGSGFTINGGATLVSDYRFRGISQTDKDFAVQGSITVSHKSGFYAGVWGSSIDDYVASGSDQEVDLIAGYKHTFEGGPTLDVGFIYYWYPGAEHFGGVDTDFFEPYVSLSHTFGPVTAKASVAYAPKQSALDYGFGKEDGLYTGLDLSGSVPGLPLTFTGHVGRSWSKNYITFGRKYTDWSVGVSYTTGPLTVGAQYVDTNKDFIGATKHISNGGFVGSVGVSF